jgi:hypothetical protein
MDPNSWAEKYNTTHPYTQEEDNMTQGAMKTLGADHKKLISDHRSVEPDTVHRTSPVQGFRGFR